MGEKIPEVINPHALIGQDQIDIENIVYMVDINDEKQQIDAINYLLLCERNRCRNIIATIKRDCGRDDCAFSNNLLKALEDIDCV